MIQFKNVSVVFGKNSALEITALKKINLEIITGDFITLIGSNGAGKSTLLNLLTGSIKADQGIIMLDQKNITAASVEQRAGDIAYVCQDPRSGTVESFTLEENLAFAFNRGAVRGLRLALTSVRRARCRALLADLGLGLENRLSDKVATLSGGQRQALSLVMAVAQPSKILLLDEHTAALDPKAASIILALTQKIIAEQQLTAIMITHHLSQALAMGNRTLFMHEGCVVHDFNNEQRSKLGVNDLVGYF